MDNKEAIAVSFDRVKKDVMFLKEKTSDWVYFLNKNDRKAIEKLEEIEKRLSRLEEALS